MLLESKVRRVLALHSLAAELDPFIGEKVSGRGFQHRPNSRRVIVDAQTMILIHPNIRLTLGWGSAHQIRELHEVREDSVCMEVLRFNEARVQANIFADGQVEIHRFEPGAWERALGLENDADTYAILPQIFVDPLNPVYQAWLELNPRPAH